jgi:hypothetical protein
MGICSSKIPENDGETSFSSTTSETTSAEKQTSTSTKEEETTFGTIFGDWLKVEDKALGKGAAGVVYKAKNAKTGQIVAVKVCSRDALSVDEEMKEVDVWKNLEHKNVVNLYSFELTKTHLFLVTEIMNGGELFDAIVSRGETIGYILTLSLSAFINTLTYLLRTHNQHVDILTSHTHTHTDTRRSGLGISRWTLYVLWRIFMRMALYIEI